MDIERLKILQEALHTTETYNQQFWFRPNESIPNFVDCQTPGCVAGHALVLFSEEEALVPSFIAEKAKELLGLTESQSRDLFQSSPYGDEWGHSTVTQQDAIEAIESLIQTGVVTWPSKQ